MRSVMLMTVCGLGFAFCGDQANAQYPIIGGGYGYGGQPVHHDYHCSVPAPLFQSGYGSYGVGNMMPPVYGGSYPQPLYAPPVSTSYYSNNYYGRPSHSHHGWHLGHYLMGHH